MSASYRWAVSIVDDVQCAMVSTARNNLIVRLQAEWWRTFWFGVITCIASMVLGAALCSAAHAGTDGDGIDDYHDNCIQHVNPSQLDTDADGFGNRCDGDFDNDGAVSTPDLFYFQNALFTTDPHADLDGDGVASTPDIPIFDSLLYQPPGPSAIVPTLFASATRADLQASGGDITLPSGDVIHVRSYRVPQGKTVDVYTGYLPADTGETFETASAPFRVMVPEEVEYVDLELTSGQYMAVEAPGAAIGTPSPYAVAASPYRYHLLSKLPREYHDILVTPIGGQLCDYVTPSGEVAFKIATDPFSPGCSVTPTYVTQFAYAVEEMRDILQPMGCLLPDQEMVYILHGPHWLECSANRAIMECNGHWLSGLTSPQVGAVGAHETVHTALQTTMGLCDVDPNICARTWWTESVAAYGEYLWDPTNLSWLYRYWDDWNDPRLIQAGLDGYTERAPGGFYTMAPFIHHLIQQNSRFNICEFSLEQAPLLLVGDIIGALSYYQYATASALKTYAMDLWGDRTYTDTLTLIPLDPPPTVDLEAGAYSTEPGMGLRWVNDEPNQNASDEACLEVIPDGNPALPSDTRVIVARLGSINPFLDVDATVAGKHPLVNDVQWPNDFLAEGTYVLGAVSFTGIDYGLQNKPTLSYRIIRGEHGSVCQ